MKRKFAFMAAKWLGKRENREKAKRTFSKFRSRVQQHKDSAEARTENTGEEQETGSGYAENHEGQSPSRDDSQFGR